MLPRKYQLISPCNKSLIENTAAKLAEKFSLNDEYLNN